MAKHSKLANDIEGLGNLIRYAEEYPQGVKKIGYYYYNVSALIEALQDIRTRVVMGVGTKADKLLLEILAGLE